MNYRSLAGYLIIIGATEFILLMIIAEAIYPGYSIAYNYISDLGVGRTAVIYNTAIIVFGILVIIASVLAGSRYYPLILLGIFLAGIGIFPENTGLPHLIFSFLTFAGSGIAAIYYSIRERFYIWSILGILGLIALILSIIGIYGPIGYGGIERMIAYPELIWALSFGSYLVTSSRRYQYQDQQRKTVS